MIYNYSMLSISMIYSHMLIKTNIILEIFLTELTECFFQISMIQANMSVGIGFIRKLSVTDKTGPLVDEKILVIHSG